MKKIILLFITVLFFCSCKEKRAVEVNIIPEPVSVIPGNDWITWGKEISLVTSTREERNVAAFLQQFLAMKGIQAAIVDSKTSDDQQVVFSIHQDTSQHREGYQLVIDKTGVHLSANSGAGLFYGVQTLFQLINSNGETIQLPFVQITDQPRFAWRGLHLDVGRHFFSVEFIKRYMDLMSHYKLNTFHWHLTEDQGWRIEIKKYPKLQEIAAFRKETVIGHASTRTRKEPHQFDGTRHGGFYTQEEIKDVVTYAAQHYITVVPEIELPGHALAALAAYPELGCTGGPYEVATTWGIFDDVFCAGKESTFNFLQDVLDEVIPLFPGQYIHIGGDECFKSNWKKCQYCQKRIKTEKLKDEMSYKVISYNELKNTLTQKGNASSGGMKFWKEDLHRMPQ